MEKETSIAVADIDDALEGATEQDADNPFAGVAGDPVVVVDDAEEHEWVNNHLLNRPCRYLLRLYNIHGCGSRSNQRRS